jgi:pimeloyl-ACP methyl ester carboxylesterase
VSFASVNSLNMHHEVHGSGRPLVMLHGGISNIEADFGMLLPTLSRLAYTRRRER